MPDKPDPPLPAEIACLEGEELLSAALDAVFKRLIQRLREGGSVEALSVARALLKDSAVGPSTDNEKRQVRTGYRLFVKALVKALQHDPSAAVLNEARHWLRKNGYLKDLSTTMTERDAVERLGSLKLPFEAPGGVQ